MTDIQIKQFILFENGRVHSIFNDETSQIIHSNPKCVTYFNRNSEQLRFLSMEQPNHENLSQKFQLSLKMLYKISSTAPKNSIQDKNTFNAENLIIYDKTEILLKTRKFQNCRWAICYIDRFQSIGSDGSITITSIDNLCKLKLHSCGQIFEFEYLKLLKNKKVQYVEAENYPNENSSNENGLAYNENISAIDLANTISSNMTAKLNSIKTMNKNGGVNSKKEFVAAYQYVKHQCLYHVSSFPIQFTYPLFAAFEKLLEINRGHINSSFMSELNPEFKEIISKLKVYGDISNEGEQFLQQYYESYYLSDGLITKINENFEKDSDFQNQHIGKKKGNDKTNDEELTMQKEINWFEDKINPCSEALKLDLYISFMVFDVFNIWFIGYEAFVLNLIDNTVFVSSQGCEFLNHIKPIYHDGMLTYSTKLLNTKFLPPTLRIYNELNGSLELEQKLSEFNQIFPRAYKTNLLNYESKQQNDYLEKQKQEKTIYQKSLEHQGKDVGPTEIINIVETEEGTCEAYNDGTVKIKFRDRTLIWFYGNQNKLKIISNMGDYVTMDIDTAKEGSFIGYVKYAMSYWENVFMPKEFHDENEQKNNQRQLLVQNHLESNNRLMMIIDKGIPIETDNTKLNQHQEQKIYDKYNDFSYSNNNNQLGYNSEKISNHKLLSTPQRDMSICERSFVIDNGISEDYGMNKNQHFLSQSRNIEFGERKEFESPSNGYSLHNGGDINAYIQNMLKANQEAIDDVNKYLKK